MTREESEKARDSLRERLQNEDKPEWLKDVGIWVYIICEVKDNFQVGVLKDGWVAGMPFSRLHILYSAEQAERFYL